MERLSGCGTLANHSVAHRLVPKELKKRWACSPGGYVRVSLGDFVGRSVFLFGDLDPKLTWIVKRLLKPGDCAIDVGANIGTLTLLMSRLVTSTGIVHAFEPNPNLYDDLTAALSRSKAGNTSVHQLALASTEGKASLYVPSSNWGAGALSKRDNCEQTIFSVQTARLDDICLEQDIALIKVDAEDAEYEVLKGGERILKRTRAIILESVHPQTDKAIKLLRSHNFEFLSIPRCLCRMRTRSDISAPAHDLVAVPHHRFQEVRALLNTT